MTAQEEPEPVYARLPMCPRCRWRKSDDAGSELEAMAFSDHSNPLPTWPLHRDHLKNYLDR